MEIAIRRATHIRAKLKVKPMKEALTLPTGWEDEKEPELFYKDYPKLIKGKAEQKMSEIQEWAHANLTVLSNQGSALIAVRDLTTNVIEGYSERSVSYTMREARKVYESLDVDCVVRADDSGPEDDPLFTNLGKAVSKLVRAMNVDICAKAQYMPYLDSPPVEPEILNTWGGFPLQRASVLCAIPDFTKTLAYAHFRDHFFAEKDEFDHWLDHVADIIQMPGRMPTNCAHLFASKAGVGKEYMAQLMGRLFGTANVCKIDKMSLYFENQFNVQYTSKLLKIFEELADEGLAFKYHEQLKNDVEAKTERVHQKNCSPYTQNNFGRTWFNTNNENKPLYIAPGDRRYTVHLLKSDKANCTAYFTPLWAELKRPEVMLSAFQYFSTRKYEEANVMNAFETQAKRDMVKRSIPHPIRFLIEKIEDGAFNCNMVCTDTKMFSINSTTMQSLYREYCGIDVRYHRSTLANSLKTHLGIDSKSIRRLDPETGKRPYYYEFTVDYVQNAMRKYLKSPKYLLNISGGSAAV